MDGVKFMSFGKTQFDLIGGCVTGGIIIGCTTATTGCTTSLTVGGCITTLNSSSTSYVGGASTLL